MEYHCRNLPQQPRLNITASLRYLDKRRPRKRQLKTDYARFSSPFNCSVKLHYRHTCRFVLSIISPQVITPGKKSPCTNAFISAIRLTETRKAFLSPIPNGSTAQSQADTCPGESHRPLTTSAIQLSSNQRFPPAFDKEGGGNKFGSSEGFICP